MLSYYNTSTGERSDIPDLHTTLDIFNKIYYDTIPLEYDSVLVSHMNKSSMLEIRVKEIITQFKDEDYFYSKIDDNIVLGRVHLGFTYLIRTHDNAKSIFIHTLNQNVDTSKNEYYRLDPAEWRIWVDLLMAEATSRITSNI